MTLTTTVYTCIFYQNKYPHAKLHLYFYFAKIPYDAPANQPEVSLYEGQFVTVITKNDGNGNTEWWEVDTGDNVGYCPAVCLEKAINFMETEEILFGDITNVDTFYH
ncbi:rho guanine nucleotide exchange factor 38-like [Octopus vulgaris]|uniref:Rho guanine nucleotide exchange factor 38-like n=1 Tax=Octopus vulgaris TaxID=6645 RepID=A0AA36AY06_OCTVU|nr:rho guanine nucleotide exchange factor 38-like [Octopus vulgaris]